MAGRDARQGLFRFFGCLAALLMMVGCSGGTPNAGQKPDSSAEAGKDGDTKVATTAATEVPVEEPPREPATVESATKIFDLRKFRVPEGAQHLGRPTLGSRSYEIKDTTRKAFEFAQNQLVDAGWKQLGDVRLDDAYSQGSFARDGFVITVSASPTGDAGMTLVSIHNYGNIPAGQVPVPTDLQTEYKFPATAGYVTKNAKVPEVAAAIRKLLLENGWQPYGGNTYDLKFSAGQSMDFKKKAIMLHVSVSTHENRPGDTMVQYSMKLLSADLPAPPNVNANGFRYSDGERLLTFDTPDKVDEVGAFYRDALGKQGWKPTTDPKGLTDMFLIFRNPAKDMIMLEVKGKKSPTHVSVKYFSAADVAEMDRREAEEKEKAKAKDREKPK